MSPRLLAFSPWPAPSRQASSGTETHLPVFVRPWQQDLDGMCAPGHFLPGKQSLPGAAPSLRGHRH